MDNLDKRYFEQMVEELKANGVSAVWLGGARHCGNYPALVAGMPGIYMGDCPCFTQPHGNITMAFMPLNKTCGQPNSE